MISSVDGVCPIAIAVHTKYRRFPVGLLAEDDVGNSPVRKGQVISCLISICIMFHLVSMYQQVFAIHGINCRCIVVYTGYGGFKFRHSFFYLVQTSVKTGSCARKQERNYRQAQCRQHFVFSHCCISVI